MMTRQEVNRLFQVCQLFLIDYAENQTNERNSLQYLWSLSQ